jgi:hypothetical protein
MPGAPMPKEPRSRGTKDRGKPRPGLAGKADPVRDNH